MLRATRERRPFSGGQPGEGPFEDIGIETTTTLLAAFLLVCAAELIAGWML